MEPKIEQCQDCKGVGRIPYPPGFDETTGRFESIRCPSCHGDKFSLNIDGHRLIGFIKEAIRCGYLEPYITNQEVK